MLMSSERAAVAEASRHLAAQGLVLGTSGNVSVAAAGQVAVTPTGGRLAGMTAEDVAVIDLDGRHLDGRLAPTSEVDMHLAVHRERGDGAVVHTHAPAATALACVLDEVPCVHYDMLRFGGAVRVAPYATFGTPELAASAARALEGRTAALLANHGTIVHAGDVGAAVELTELLEWACTVYRRAVAVGEPRVLSQEQLEAVLAAVVERRYGTTTTVEGR